jgi:TetR/AcrR family transcriptional regulator, repressor for divergent bdcA
LNNAKGRPRKFNKEAGIVTATFLFNKLGYQGLGVAEICRTLGITATSLYATYGSKFELFKAVVVGHCERFIEELVTRIEEADSSESLFRKVLELSVENFTRDPDQPGSLLFDGAINNADPLVVELIKQKTSEYSNIIRLKLAELGAENPDEFTSFIITLQRGLSSSSRSEASTQELMMTVEFYCSLLEY